MLKNKTVTTSDGEDFARFMPITDSSLLIAHCSLRQTAFTLAEVLITLGIIGIVAAMTIPTLIANYQQKSWSTASFVFQRKLTEALRQMNTQHDLGKYGGYSTTEGFVEALQRYLKINKVCDNDELGECFEDTIYSESDEIDMSGVTMASHFGQDEWGTNIVGIQVANGTTALIAYNPDCISNPYDNTIAGDNCYAIIYDTSGYSKPNELNKDVVKINAPDILPFSYIKVACSQEGMEGWGGTHACNGTHVIADTEDLTVTDISKFAPGTVSADGTKFSKEAAKQACAAKGMRVPNASEAHSMWKSGATTFKSDNYWIDSSGAAGCTDRCQNCYLGGRNCGMKDGSALNYVRCVK